MAFLFFLFIAGILYAFYRFHSKLKNLENEIFDLKRTIEKSEISEKSTEKDIITELRSEEKITRFENDLTNSQITFIPNEKREDLPTKESWLEGILDFTKQNLLTIIGIFTLVIGIGYFVKYAIDKNWIGETMRFLIGILIGLGILGLGYFLKKNYKIFSAILSGGGLAVLYLSITIAFQEYQLFSQTTAFVILLFVTILAVLISYFYESEVLIVFALIGGFCSPLMISDGNSNYLFLFSYLSILNLGMLFIAYLKNWKSIGWIAFFATYCYLVFWIMDRFQFVSLYFFIFFYFVFYAFALRNYFKKSALENKDILLLVLINIMTVTGVFYIFNRLNLEPLSLFPILFALINGLIWLFAKRRNQQNLYHPIFVGISLSLITVAVALQFKTHLITSIWAIESVLILYLWKKTRAKIFDQAFTVLIFLIIIAEVFTWSKYSNIENLKPFFNPIFLTGILVSITLGINYFLLKTSGKLPERKFFREDYVKFLTVGNLFLVGLLEILNQLPNENETYISLTCLLYSLYFIFILLVLNRYLFNRNEEKIFLVISVVLSLLLISLPDFMGVLFRKEISYGYYLLYLLPFTFAIYRFIKGKFLESKSEFWFIGLSLVFMISFEFFHFYLWKNLDQMEQSSHLQQYFTIFFLPIIWTIISVIYLFIGLKKELPELTKIGFFLIILMAIKLYTFDVWKMDNISRIIAFIILGIILLSSSFTFQKLKGIFNKLK